VLGGFDELGQVLQRLPQRGSSEREGLIVSGGITEFINSNQLFIA
jgi:hypothetical protein